MRRTKKCGRVALSEEEIEIIIEKQKKKNEATEQKQLYDKQYYEVLRVMLKNDIICRRFGSVDGVIKKALDVNSAIHLINYINIDTNLLSYVHEELLTSSFWKKRA